MSTEVHILKEEEKKKKNMYGGISEMDVPHSFMLYSTHLHGIRSPARRRKMSCLISCTLGKEVVLSTTVSVSGWMDG